MRFRSLVVVSSAILLTCGLPQRARAQADESTATVELVVDAGRPLQVALDQRVSVKHVGQPGLATTLESSKTPRGTPIEAIVTEPVFSSDHRLILPEGTTLRGEVTLAKQARRFHRNGQLRFLFESVQPPRQDASRLLASLDSVRASGDDHLMACRQS